MRRITFEALDFNSIVYPACASMKPRSEEAARHLGRLLAKLADVSTVAETTWEDLEQGRIPLATLDGDTLDVELDATEFAALLAQLGAFIPNLPGVRAARAVVLLDEYMITPKSPPSSPQTE